MGHYGCDEKKISDRLIPYQCLEPSCRFYLVIWSREKLVSVIGIKCHVKNKVFKQLCSLGC